MIQDFDGLVGRFPRRREYMAAAGVCAGGPGHERRGARLVAHGSDIHERDLTYRVKPAAQAHTMSRVRVIACIHFCVISYVLVTNQPGGARERALRRCAV